MDVSVKDDVSTIEAKFENGVLKVSLPKPPEAEAKVRKIPVQSAA